MLDPAVLSVLISTVSAVAVAATAAWSQRLTAAGERRSEAVERVAELSRHLAAAEQRLQTAGRTWGDLEQEHRLTRSQAALTKDRDGVLPAKLDELQSKTGRTAAVFHARAGGNMWREQEQFHAEMRRLSSEQQDADRAERRTILDQIGPCRRVTHLLAGLQGGEHMLQELQRVSGLPLNHLRGRLVPEDVLWLADHLVLAGASRPSGRGWPGDDEIR